MNVVLHYLLGCRAFWLYTSKRDRRCRVCVRHQQQRPRGWAGYRWVDV